MDDQDCPSEDFEEELESHPTDISASPDHEDVIPLAVWQDFNRGCVRRTYNRSDLNRGFFNVYKCASNDWGASYVSMLAVVACSAENQSIAQALFRVQQSDDGDVKVEHLRNFDMNANLKLHEQRLVGHLPDVNYRAFQHFACETKPRSSSSNAADLGQSSTGVAPAEIHLSTIWADEVLKEIWRRGMMKRPEEIVPDPRWFHTFADPYVVKYVAMYAAMIAIAVCVHKYDQGVRNPD